MNVRELQLNSMKTFVERVKAAATVFKSDSYILIDMRRIHAIIQPGDATQLAENLEDFLPQLNKTAREYNNVG